MELKSGVSRDNGVTIRRQDQELQGLTPAKKALAESKDEEMVEGASPSLGSPGMVDG